MIFSLREQTNGPTSTDDKMAVDSLRFPVHVNLSFILSRKLFFPRRFNSEHLVTKVIAKVSL